MKLVVFGYNFPHWKTNTGLLHMCANGFKPDLVILQDKKPLNIPQSKYRVTPEYEYQPEPRFVCASLGIPVMFADHNSIVREETKESLGVILGARILPANVVNSFKAILNIHPGILPGNRGLDNLKWSIIKGLPVGVTAHLIDERIDMGKFVCAATLSTCGKSIRELFIEQRELQMQQLIRALKILDGHCMGFAEIAHSPKFSAVPEDLDIIYSDNNYMPLNPAYVKSKIA